jgi:lipid-A-disaccharide synthase
MEVEYRLRRIHRIEHIGMPNILAGERIVPEFIQQQARPEALAEATLRFLRDPETRARTRDALLQVRTRLGTPGASARTAQMALELAGLAK